MTATLILLILLGYFSILLTISFLTGRKSDNSSFFVGNRKSPWFVVAFGMIGASLSGVTFISVPGEVGASNFSYMQVVLGYLIGYIVIANVLMPLYYRMNLTSIYTYLDKRFGNSSYKTGASFFLLSRVIGASFRLYLVAIVLDRFVFGTWGIPFWVTVAVTILLIWIYSFKAGIKTIVWTDTLQTFFMLAAVILSIFFIAKELNMGFGEFVDEVSSSRYSKIFVWDWAPGNNFFKHFVSGAFITIVMTGLDQDMMQKNLSCKNIKEAKKNMYWMSSSLIVVNLVFLLLGALLYIYANRQGLILENFADPAAVASSCPIELQGPSLDGFQCARTDQLFPTLAMNFLPPVVGIVFVLGLIAAAYSSADSALTALTTSFCVDFLGFGEKESRVKTRYLVHIGFSLVLFVVILIFYSLNDDSVINSLFKAAGYTYGPLLGMFAFGVITRKEVKDRVVPFIAVASPVLCYVLNLYSEQLFMGYKFGFELLIVNGIITFIGLLVISRKSSDNKI